MKCIVVVMYSFLLQKLHRSAKSQDFIACCLSLIFENEGTFTERGYTGMPATQTRKISMFIITLLAISLLNSDKRDFLHTNLTW